MTDLVELGDRRVTVVGLGLMGASLAGALRGRCRRIVGVARRSDTINEALARQYVDDGTTDLAQGVRESDIVVLATPVRTILHQLDEIGPLLPDGCLLVDLGSTKQQIVAKMGTLPDHVQPLGGHPMCGKEVSGIAAADPMLYQGRTFILTPLPRTSAFSLELGTKLALAIGARPLVLSAERQDFLVATMSHLPYLLACALIRTADATTSPDPATWEIVAGGFRDTSRVAGSDVTMMLDILLTNRDEVLKAVKTYSSHLSDLGQYLENHDENALRTALGSIRAKRIEMFP